MEPGRLLLNEYRKLGKGWQKKMEEVLREGIVSSKFQVTLR
jgi:uncharacterized protein (DUF4415 family)